MTYVDVSSSPISSSPKAITATSSPRSSLSLLNKPSKDCNDNTRRKSSLGQISELTKFQDYKNLNSPTIVTTSSTSNLSSPSKPSSDNNNNDSQIGYLPNVSPKPRRGSECGSLSSLKTDQNESKKSSERRMSLPNLQTSTNNYIDTNNLSNDNSIPYTGQKSRRQSISQLNNNSDQLIPQSPITPQPDSIRSHRRSISSSSSLNTLSSKDKRRLSIRDTPNERGSVSRRASLTGLQLPNKSWCDFTTEVTPSVWKNYVQNWEDDKINSKQIFLLANDLYLFYKEQYTEVTKKQNPKFADNQIESAVERHMKRTFADKETRYEQTLNIEKLIISELCKSGERFIDKHTFYTKWPHFINDHFNVVIQSTKKDMKCIIM